MNFSRINTEKAYCEGLKTRQDERGNPVDMPFSTYKVLECYEDFRSTKDELLRIGEYSRGDRSLKYKFEHCVHWDKHVWAKRIAAYNSFCLARNLVGVVHALPGDGVSKEVVDDIQDELRRRVPHLIALGERARIESKNAWRYTSKLLGTGECLLDQFNDKCLELIEWVMDAIIASNPTCPSGPYSSYVNGRHRRKLKGNANALPH